MKNEFTAFCAWIFAISFTIFLWACFFSAVIDACGGVV